MLVGGVIVDDEVDVELSRDIGVDVAQEGEEFLMAMALLALAEDLSAGDVQSSKQRCGAMANIIMGTPST